MRTPRAAHDGPTARPGWNPREQAGFGTPITPAATPRDGPHEPDRAPAWAMGFDDCESTISRVLRRFPLQDTDRDDCRQVVWEAILTTRCARFRGGNPTAWLAALTRNKAIDFLRRRRRSPHLSLLSDDIGTTTDDAEQDRIRARSIIWPALGRLEACSDPRSFLVFFLHWIEGWPIREAAEILGLEPGQARQRHHRMMIKVRKLVGARPSAGDPPMSASETP
jgi:RNA polymerase sigma-70 factor (ECF subfamily)